MCQLSHNYAAKHFRIHWESYRSRNIKIRLNCHIMSKRVASMLKTDDTTITEPSYNDVLLGRGGKNNRHTGNDELRKIAKKHCTKYRTSQKKEKTAITRRIVSDMRNLSPPTR